MNAVAEERAPLPLNSAAAILVWSALEPLNDALFAPLRWLSDSADWSLDKRKATWAAIRQKLNELGTPPEALALLEQVPMEGWLSTPELQELKRGFLQELGRADTLQIVRRFRLGETLPLIRRYYQKRRTLAHTRKDVLTKRFARVLSGLHGGDWLEFLAYLEEKPTPCEVEQSSLPEVTIAPRVPPKAATSLFPDEADTNPVHERLAVLKRFWDEFLSLHAAHPEGRGNLWGLVDADDRLRVPAASHCWLEGEAQGLYKKTLSSPLQSKIEKLWATRVFGRYPDRIATNLAPYHGMAKALGPALKFWEGVLLTCWFVCEGKFSRTDLPGAEEHYGKQLDLLQHCGAPVDRILFKELLDGEHHLGKPEETSPGGFYSRRAGYGILRDIVIRHARVWTHQYLDSYLEKEWKSPLEELGMAVAKRLASKGKPFTAKQYAKKAESIANRWFGGDLTAVSLSLLQPPPVSQSGSKVVPEDLFESVNFAFARWTDFAKKHDFKTDARDYSDTRLYLSAECFTRLTFRLWQVTELLGEIPSYEVFDKALHGSLRGSISRLARNTKRNEDTLWALFLEVVTQIGRDLRKC